MSTQVTKEEKLVMFRIGKSLLAVPVDQVIEVYQPEIITPIPQSPPNLAGVINFRGQIVPVIDLAGKLALQGQPDEEALYVIISDKLGGMAGILVDYVESVISVNPKDIKTTGEVLGKRIEDIPYLTGITMTEQGIVLIIDLGKIASVEEFKFFEELRKSSPATTQAPPPSKSSSSDTMGFDLEKLTKNELVQIASELGVTNPSSKTKSQLIDLIKEKMGI